MLKSITYIAVLGLYLGIPTAYAIHLFAFDNPNQSNQQPTKTQSDTTPIHTESDTKAESQPTAQLFPSKHESEPTLQTPRIVIPCKVIEVYDGDTPTVQITIKARIRLLDCWAPEVKSSNPIEKSYGIHARETLKELISQDPNPQQLLIIPLDNVDRLDDVFTFGRLLGRIQLSDGRDVSQELERMGVATATKW